MNMFAPALWTRWWDTLDKSFRPQDQPQPPNPSTWTWNCGTCDLAYFPTDKFLTCDKAYFPTDKSLTCYKAYFSSDKPIVPHLLAWMGRRTIAKRKSARQTERMQGVVTWARRNKNVLRPKASFLRSSHLRGRPRIINIIITRPKPAYGQQGLAGSWGQDTDQAGTFWGVLNVSLRAQLRFKPTWNLEKP